MCDCNDKGHFFGEWKEFEDFMYLVRLRNSRIPEPLRLIRMIFNTTNTVIAFIFEPSVAHVFVFGQNIGRALFSFPDKISAKISALSQYFYVSFH